ncbi:unnamed protein product, partial [Urochloa humidicola]
RAAPDRVVAKVTDPIGHAGSLTRRSRTSLGATLGSSPEPAGRRRVSSPAAVIVTAATRQRKIRRR